MTGITKENLSAFARKFESDPANAIRMNAAVKNGIASASARYDLARRMRHEFSIELKNGDITDQKSSGRCWMFASLNIMRFETMARFNIKNIEFSQTYPLFWDKLEKANYFLESILETLSEPLEGRLVSHLLKAPVQDGGQWDMFVGLVEKYGIVPKSAMPEAFHSGSTALLNKFLTLKLREQAYTLRKGHEGGKVAAALSAMKEDMLCEIYKMLCVALGTPPESFTFEYRDKDDVFHRESAITPKDFYDKYVGMDLSRYVSLINAPTADKPYGECYTVKYLGSVKGGRPIRYLNVPPEVLKQAAISQLSAGKPVMHGCDVGQFLERESGVMDTGTYDAAGLFATEFTLDKAARLDYGESLLTHAMVFLGVNIDENGVADRWKVENSWGDKNGNKGYYIMSGEWFDQFNYQIAVDRQYLPEPWRSALDKKAIELEPWDPMGALAIMI